MKTTRHTRAGQARRILNHLKSGGSITPMFAMTAFGCFRLGARIWELRKAGHRITSTIVRRNGARVAQYRLA